MLCIGRFGPYLKCGKIMAHISKKYNPFDLDDTKAHEIVDNKIERDKKKNI